MQRHLLFRDGATYRTEDSDFLTSSHPDFHPTDVMQDADGSLELHREWISSLLEQYYDPMYEYQLGQREGEVLFRGTRDAVVHWASGAG